MKRAAMIRTMVVAEGTHRVLLVVGAFLLVACADNGRDRTTATAVAVEDVSADRSLDVSYRDGTIELSFERLGNQFRGMYARVLQRQTENWTYFGYLRTEQANEIGVLITDPEEEVMLLDGVNNQLAPDLYSAPQIGAGEYLICTSLVDPGAARTVCGDLVVMPQD